MKRLAYVPVLALLFLGCTNTGFLGFIATTGYVDKHISTTREETDARLAETSNDVNKVKSDVETLNSLKSTLQSLIGDIERNKESTQELKTLTAQLSSRLDSIPQETLQTLVQILQDYLGRKNPTAPSKSN
ncbi:MAG TPA: hypothetical protein VMW87_01845 [Spirochaetia bacterium]|nr:hypothetical protein [Spirochaetia bacterium]